MITTLSHLNGYDLPRHTGARQSATVLPHSTEITFALVGELEVSGARKNGIAPKIDGMSGKIVYPCLRAALREAAACSGDIIDTVALKAWVEKGIKR